MTQPINKMSTAELQAEVDAMRKHKEWDRSPRICALPGCGQIFTPTRKWQAFHDEHCRRQAYWKKNETVSVDYAPAVAWALAKLATQTKYKVNPFYGELEELLKRLKG